MISVRAMRNPSVEKVEDCAADKEPCPFVVLADAGRHLVSAGCVDDMGSWSSVVGDGGGEGSGDEGASTAPVAEERRWAAKMAPAKSSDCRVGVSGS